MNDEKRSCEYCDCFQAFYVKSQGKFLKTEYGYCSVKGSACICNNSCRSWKITTEQEKFYPLTAENAAYVLNYLNKMIEKIGLLVDDNYISNCTPATDDTPYNSKLK